MGTEPVSSLTIKAPLALAQRETPSNDIDSSEFSRNYTQLTKRITLSAIELERFSLKYRQANIKQPPLRKLRYFVGQEAGSSCLLAFEIVTLHQTSIGQKNPLKINQRSLKHGIETAMIGSSIAGASSALELTSNVLREVKLCRDGYGPGAAKFVVSRLKEIDKLLAEREALVEANKDNPAYQRAVVEGKILACMRDAFAQEFSTFYSNTRGYGAFQNTFFFLNACYNTVGAISAGYALRGVSEPKFNKAANILFIVSGAMASATPLISTACGIAMRKYSKYSLRSKLNQKSDFNLSEMTAQQKLLGEMLPSTQGSLMPSLPATARAALYTQSGELFQKQFDSETRTMRRLNQVALQTNEIGPIIGGLLMTQGILSTEGVTTFATRPRRQIGMLYDGAIVGTVGSGMAVAGNAAWLLMSWNYERRLKKQNRLPSQLIDQRLKHLDELESIINAL